MPLLPNNLGFLEKGVEARSGVEARKGVDARGKGVLIAVLIGVADFAGIYTEVELKAT